MRDMPGAEVPSTRDRPSDRRLGARKEQELRLSTLIEFAAYGLFSLALIGYIAAELWGLRKRERIGWFRQHL